MKHKSIFNYHIKINVLLFTLIALVGCSTIEKDDVRENNITIKRIHSEDAIISVVNLENTSTGIYIRGQLRRKYIRRGAIPGHLDIEIKSPEGKTLYKQKVAYMRRNTQSSYSRFYQAIDVKPVSGSTILIKHHPTYNIIDHSDD